MGKQINDTHNYPKCHGCPYYFGEIDSCMFGEDDVPQDIGMMFIGISKMDCNDIVEELLKYGYVDISDYDYTNILIRTQIKIIDHDLCF